MISFVQSGLIIHSFTRTNPLYGHFIIYLDSSKLQLRLILGGGKNRKKNPQIPGARQVYDDQVKLYDPSPEVEKDAGTA